MNIRYPIYEGVYRILTFIKRFSIYFHWIYAIKYIWTPNAYFKNSPPKDKGNKSLVPSIS